MQHNYLTMTIPEAWEGRTVYRILRDEYLFSAEKIRSVKFSPEGIFLNESRVPVNTRVRAGDTLRLLLDDSENRKLHVLPNPGALQILYEDRNLLLLNKPAGTVCHPSRGHLIDSLANYVRAYFDETDPYANIHFIGRLDKDTSGIVMIAKNGVYAEALQREKEGEAFVKTYLALAKGHFEEKCGTVRIPMSEWRNPESGTLFMIKDEEHGKAAETRYEVLSEGDGYSVLKVTLGTGRMHQIRFHMSALGHPLLSDPLYGDGTTDPRIRRTALHACSLRFTLPFTGEEKTVSAALPEDMKGLFSEENP